MTKSNHLMKGIAAIILVCDLVITSFPVFAKSNSDVKNSAGDVLCDINDDSNDYASYLAKINNNISGEKIMLKANYANEFKNEIAEDKQCIAFNDQNSTATWDFTVEKAGLYALKITYLNMETKSAFEELKLNVLVDGKNPYAELSSVLLPILWKNETEIKSNKLGNEYQPSQIQVYQWQEKYLYDDTGIYEKPFSVFLSKGNHTISLSRVSGNFYVASLLLDGTSKTKSYSDIKKDYEKLGLKEYDGEPITVEGEKAYLKSEKSIALKSDNTNPAVRPNDPYKTKINYIGGDSWSACGQTVYYKIYAPKDALYKLGFHYLQSYSLGGYSYRRLEIDGEVPFEEAASIPFSYNDNWKYSYFSNKENEPYLFHLTQGEHTIAITVTMGDFAEINRRLRKIVLSLGDNYRKIVRITGETPDVNRDYNLFGQISGLKESFANISKELKEIVAQLQSITGRKGNSDIVVLQNMSVTIDEMLSHPFQAQDYKDSYYNNYCSTGSILYSMRNLALGIDCFEFLAPDTESKRKNHSWFSKMSFSLKRFFYSFSNDYNYVSKSNLEDALDLWIYWGRDQTQIFEKIVEESFVSKYDIPVNIKIVNSSLILAMLSDNCPDLSLRVDGSQVVNLALRGALHDISKFEDYDETIKMFSPTAAEPFKFNGGVYALPDTETFEIMFYRTDIFKELGLKPPKTWSEFLYCVTVLARSNLQVGLPAPSTSSAGIYPTLLLQNGGQLYTDDRKATNISSAESIKAFSTLTKMFIEYGLPVSYDFYNRFRSGEMPLGIASYTLYNQLAVTAPEIDGKWGISTIPGTETKDGINSKITGIATGDVILRNSKNIENAWKFIKWWNSAEVQARFSNETEAILGEVARSAPANIEALSMLGWNRSDLQVILKQWENVSELPQVPGNYYVARSIGMAFWNVYNKHDDPKDTIIYWGNVADREIERKLTDYGLY